MATSEVDFPQPAQHDSSRKGNGGKENCGLRTAGCLPVNHHMNAFWLPDELTVAYIK